MKTKTKKIIMCATGIAGVGFTVFVLKTWSLNGPLSFFSYMSAILIYVASPLIVVYGLLFDKKLKTLQ